ncbi:MAG: cyclic nucleotide-binding domain-containing protein [Desulfovibrio sp.]|uniref:cyclic nucleotide-binding domain-containing protein n=1 Tax=Desulfovibrio sp. 7SRBS1 TaxID=3378064 RepID=UPI003B3F4209
MKEISWPDIQLFSGMTPEQIDTIRPIFFTREYQAGQTLIEEGEMSDEMFVLVSGRVRISKSMLIKGMSLPLAEMTNPRKVLATLDETHYPTFGEMALLDRDTRSATVEVVEDSSFLVTDRSRFFALVASHPDVGCKILTALGKSMAGMVRKANVDMVKLTTALALSLGKKIGGSQE